MRLQHVASERKRVSKARPVPCTGVGESRWKVCSIEGGEARVQCYASDRRRRLKPVGRGGDVLLGVRWLLFVMDFV